MSDRVALPSVGGPGGESCGGCYFWVYCPGLTEDHGQVGMKFGRCKRYPDRYVANVKDNSDDWLNWIQPTKMEQGWCGEYRARAEK